MKGDAEGKSGLRSAHKGTPLPGEGQWRRKQRIAIGIMDKQAGKTAIRASVLFGQRANREKKKPAAAGEWVRGGGGGGGAGGVRAGGICKKPRLGREKKSKKGIQREARGVAPFGKKPGLFFSYAQRGDDPGKGGAPGPSAMVGAGPFLPGHGPCGGRGEKSRILPTLVGKPKSRKGGPSAAFASP